MKDAHCTSAVYSFLCEFSGGSISISLCPFVFLFIRLSFLFSPFLYVIMHSKSTHGAGISQGWNTAKFSKKGRAAAVLFFSWSTESRVLGAFCQRASLSINVLIHFYIWESRGQETLSQREKLQEERSMSVSPHLLLCEEISLRMFGGTLNKGKYNCNRQKLCTWTMQITYCNKETVFDKTCLPSSQQSYIR